ncbi:hypothetical protein L208DRAFT_56850 [Tricholoma matsutake]|nr:hypothetical protein L208DRAFT_56850 [Tricholoma matsutake 945]
MLHGCRGMACRRFPIEKDQSTNMTKFTSGLSQTQKRQSPQRLGRSLEIAYLTPSTN